MNNPSDERLDRLDAYAEKHGLTLELIVCGGRGEHEAEMLIRSRNNFQRLIENLAELVTDAGRIIGQLDDSFSTVASSEGIWRAIEAFVEGEIADGT